MGGVEQSDWCYSGPTAVLAIGALRVEEKTSVPLYKAEHAASKKMREEGKKSSCPFARREIVHGDERPRRRGEPALPRGLPVCPPLD